MSEVLQQWITRIMFILSFVAVFFIGRGVINNYKTLTVDQIIKDYANDLRSGYVENLSSLQIACAELGYYDTEITVQNLKNPDYQDDFSDETPRHYKLEYLDFVIITTTNGKRTLRATYVYRGETAR